ncbi:hypothetical protein BC938DRAFT_480967 [Jimgerdemannia flammicorona]|uniref:Uncharacterized protein n=1 Tax=Jimgerdemannia flammicorona TaxID=994334 RepID=A0A433QXC8_9FUNG|nr:hypothetical protein BC938DRAFT_480967 [Jimgerdemannia flammicorona]
MMPEEQSKAAGEKSDFSFDSSREHFEIAKFLEHIPKTTDDERWVLAANGIEREARTREVRAFWLEVEKELKEREVEVAQIQFAANCFKTGNKVHDIQDRARVDYVSDLHGRLGSQVKRRDSDVNDESEDDDEDLDEGLNSEYLPSIASDTEESPPIKISKVSKESDPFLRSLIQSIDDVRELPDGHYSPIYYRVIDIRPPSLTHSDIRASSLIEVPYLKILHDKAENISMNASRFSDSVDKILKVLEQVGFGSIYVVCMYVCVLIPVCICLQLSAQSIESLTRHLGSEGASGLLRRLKANEYRTSNPVTLSELLEGEIHSNTVVSNITNDLTSLSGEDGEIQWVFRAIEDCGEGESRVSRFRREEGKTTAKPVGDRFDWLFSNYQLFPDNVRGLELGIAQNSGPTHLEAADKSRADLVKAVKTARDQLNHIIRTIQNDYGSADLSERLRSGIAALSVVAVHVVGFRIMVNIVFHVGSNVFAIAEMGSAYLPHSIESIHDALSMCRLTLKIKSLIARSKKLVQALRAEAQRTRVSFSGIAKDQFSVTEMPTPKKARK